MVLKMSSPVKNSHGMWNTRLTVPAELRPIIKKRELKRSLKTKNEREARLLHPIVLSEFQAELERARRILESESHLTDTTIQSIVFKWRKSVATSFASNRNAVNPYLKRYSGTIEGNNDEVSMVLDDIASLGLPRQDDKVIKPEIIEKKYDKYYKQLHMLLSDDLSPYLAKLEIEPDLYGDNYRKLLFEFAKTYISLTENALKREWVNIDSTKQGVTLLEGAAFDELAGPSIAELWEEYQTTLIRRNPDRAKSRIRDYSVAMIKFLKEYGDKSVSAIKKRDISKFRLLLEQLPTRPDKVMKALSLRAQIEKATKENLPRTTATSVKNQINAISAVFTYAVSQDYISTNPVIGTISDIKTRKATQEGKGFSNEQISQIFSSKLFHDNYRPALADYGEAVYWIPLILYYTGARVEEIAQLYIADISLEHEIPHIRIHGEREDQSVKTGESRRVPLHDHLIELGFVEYVASLPAGGRLFPKLTNTGTERKYNTGVRVWFSKYLREELGVNHEGMKPMHDFRHSFITACRERGVRIDVQRSITGHAQPDVASQYGSFSLELMNELIQGMPKCFDD